MFHQYLNIQTAQYRWMQQYINQVHHGIGRSHWSITSHMLYSLSHKARIPSKYVLYTKISALFFINTCTRQSEKMGAGNCIFLRSGVTLSKEPFNSFCDLFMDALCSTPHITVKCDHVTGYLKQSKLDNYDLGLNCSVYFWYNSSSVICPYTGMFGCMYKLQPID